MEVFWEKTPYGQIFTNVFQSPTCGHGNTSFCANFVKFGRPEVGEIARCLMDKKNKISARAPAAASARIAPKICQGQLQTIYLEFSKFHLNLFTSGGVIAERVNIVQTRHKVFAILGEVSASSPSNNCSDKIKQLQETFYLHERTADGFNAYSFSHFSQLLLMFAQSRRLVPQCVVSLRLSAHRVIIVSSAI